MTPIEETASRIYDHLAGLPSMQMEQVRQDEQLSSNTLRRKQVAPKARNKLRQQILSEWKGEQS